MTIFAKRQLINRNTIGEDLTAGLVLGIQSVPDGLANGLLAMVNPVYGLYGYMTGIFSGAFFTSSVFMSIQATGAMALIIASVPQVTEAPEPNTALFALAILTGLIMLGRTAEARLSGAICAPFGDDRVRQCRVRPDCIGAVGRLHGL